ncbi:MAG: CAP domain-containing protein [Patescibacteria group bacterium]
MHTRHRIGHMLMAFGVFLWLSTSTLLAFGQQTALASIDVGSVHTLSNQERTGAGLDPYVLDSKLAAAAQAKAQHMLDNGYFAHTAPDGTEGWDFIASQGYEYSTAGENLASSNQNSQSVVTGWMNSPGHRANLLNTTYTEVGYGSVYVGAWEYEGVTYSNTHYVVALYAKPPADPPPEPEPEPEPEPDQTEPEPTDPQPEPTPDPTPQEPEPEIQNEVTLSSDSVAEPLDSDGNELVEYTQDDNITLTGNTEPDARVEITINDTETLEPITVDQEGSWTFVLSGLAPGQYSLTVKAYSQGSEVELAAASNIGFEIIAAEAPEPVVENIPEDLPVASVAPTSSSGLRPAVGISLASLGALAIVTGITLELRWVKNHHDLDFHLPHLH